MEGARALSPCSRRACSPLGVGARRDTQSGEHARRLHARGGGAALRLRRAGAKQRWDGAKDAESGLMTHVSRSSKCEIIQKKRALGLNHLWLAERGPSAL